MSNYILESNSDLCKYLLALEGLLREKELFDLADAIHRSSRFFIGSPSEFLYEAELALKKVRDDKSGLLGPQKIVEVANVIIQIQNAFNRVGGA